MEPVPVSIIIPTLNEEHYLPKLLDSLQTLSLPLDVIVVDAGSSDRTKEVAHGYIPHFTGTKSLRFFTSDVRRTSYQRNFGALRARHDIIAFCDSDIVITHADAFEQLIQRFARKGHAVAGTRLVPLEKGKRIHFTFALLFTTEKLLSLFGRHFYPGMFILTRRDVFVSTGGFDTEIILAEDIDFSVRAARHGTGQVFHAPIGVSARRIIKYGYGWIFKEWRNIVHLMRTGKIAQDIHYPFGEFNEPSPSRASSRE